MGLNKSGEIFLITGLAIFSAGYLFHIKDVGDMMGALFMISGSSLIVASFVELISKWIHLKF